MTRITRTALLAAVACTVALASGCGSGSSSSDSATAAKKVSGGSVGVKAPGLIAFRRYTDPSQAEGAVFTIKPDGTGERQVTHPLGFQSTYINRVFPDGSKGTAPWEENYTRLVVSVIVRLVVSMTHIALLFAFADGSRRADP